MSVVMLEHWGFPADCGGAQALPLTALEDDCKLLGTLLDECLRNEVGAEFMAKVERIRSLAAAAKDLSQKNDQVVLALGGVITLPSRLPLLQAKATSACDLALKRSLLFCQQPSAKHGVLNMHACHRQRPATYMRSWKQICQRCPLRRQYP